MKTFVISSATFFDRTDLVNTFHTICFVYYVFVGSNFCNGPVAHL